MHAGIPMPRYAAPVTNKPDGRAASTASTQRAWCGRYWANAPGQRLIRDFPGRESDAKMEAEVVEDSFEDLVVGELERRLAIAAEGHAQDLPSVRRLPVPPLLGAERSGGY